MQNNKAVPAKIRPSFRVKSGVQTNLIYGDQALADTLHAGLSTIRTWRNKRVIPFIKTGHKSIIYDLNKVLKALDVFEIKPVTTKEVR